jgi:hypothetical protein
VYLSGGLKTLTVCSNSKPLGLKRKNGHNTSALHLHFNDDDINKSSSITGMHVAEDREALVGM